MKGICESRGSGDFLEGIAGDEHGLGLIQAQPQQMAARRFPGLLPIAVGEERDRNVQMTRQVREFEGVSVLGFDRCLDLRR